MIDKIINKIIDKIIDKIINKIINKMTDYKYDEEFAQELEPEQVKLIIKILMEKEKEKNMSIVGSAAIRHIASVLDSEKPVWANIARQDTPDWEKYSRTYKIGDKGLPK